MGERELEQVMKGFYQQRFNVLLCTTIIETGIDVPTANTIIMHRADKFGLGSCTSYGVVLVDHTTKLMLIYSPLVRTQSPKMHVSDLKPYKRWKTLVQAFS